MLKILLTQNSERSRNGRQINLRRPKLRKSEGGKSTPDRRSLGEGGKSTTTNNQSTTINNNKQQSTTINNNKQQSTTINNQ
ncbi:MAG: hypothetical protein H6562_19505 [Lewinellaceae bacterium]|nr:hypothetical protein [Lewinellaceae bacterium]